jgi:pyochelin biosynthetic protein PchC
MTTEGHENTWIRRYHPATPGSIQLVCLPHPGGSATFYFPVSRALAPDVDVLAIQYPGRQDRRMERSVPELARRIFRVLDDRTDRPLALLGHSTGASLAFEMARLLEHEEGVVPRRLFASGRRAPSRYREEQAEKTYRYVPGPPLSCPVTVFVGDADPTVTLDEARSWRDHTTGSFDCRSYPGGRFFLYRHQAAVVGVIAAQLVPERSRPAGAAPQA